MRFLHCQHCNPFVSHELVHLEPLVSGGMRPSGPTASDVQRCQFKSRFRLRFPRSCGIRLLLLPPLRLRNRWVRARGGLLSTSAFAGLSGIAATVVSCAFIERRTSSGMPALSGARDAPIASTVQVKPRCRVDIGSRRSWDVSLSGTTIAFS